MKFSKKRILSLVLVLCLFMTFIPIKTEARTIITSSSNTTGNSYSSTYASKLDKIFQGSVALFSNSSEKYALGQSLNINKQYSVAGKLSGYQCYIYANAVYYYLFGDIPYHGSGLNGYWNNSKTVLTNQVSASYHTFLYAGVGFGAYVRTTGNSDGSYNGSAGHSLIVLTYDNATITYLEGNANGNGLVRITMDTWDEFNQYHVSGQGRRISHIVQCNSAPPINGAVNLGTSFTAPILNKEHWKIIENNDCVALTADEKGISKQLWYFERQSDGSYKISSCYDGRCLDVANASNASGVKVGAVTSNDSDAQRWYIYEEAGGYILKAKCTDCVLDLPNNDPTNGNQLQMYTRNGTGAQIWAIYRGTECIMQSPTLSVNVATSAASTKFTWDNVYGESRYDVKIWKGTAWDGDAYHIEWGATSGWAIQLPAGTYQAYVDASNYYECKMSNIVTFTVSEPAPTIDTRYPTPFRANTRLWWNTSDGRTPVYDAINGNQKGYIYNGYNNEDDHCTIEEVYTNGWCKVTVPGLDGVRYCQLSVFVNVIDGYNPWWVVSPSDIDGYRRWDHGSPSGYIAKGDNVCIISETESMYQTIYPGTNGNVSRWVDRCLLAHMYTNSTTAPSCTAQGYTTHTCKFCGYSYKDTYVNATGHSYSYAATKNPTTSETGTLTGTCSKCKGTTMETLPNLNTTDYTYAVKTAATCTTDGTGTYTWKTTTYGNFSFNVTLPKTGHSYSYAATKNPTTSETGTLTGTCSKCKGTTTETLPNLNTTDYTYAVKTAATCTVDGTGTYTWKTTTYGNFSFNVTLTKTGHSHSYTVTKDPTISANGTLTVTCSECKETTTVTLPKLTATDYTYTVKTAATCTADGTGTYTWKTTTYGSFSFNVTLTKTGHSYSYAVTKDPTTSTTGTLTGTCSKCNGTTTVTLPKLTTTDYTYAVKTAATCTADGTGTYTWNTTTYGSFSFNVTLSKTGHSYDTGVITTAATCTQSGIKTYTCGNCGFSYTKDVAATGHSYSYAVTKDPTTSATGTLTGTCSKCNGTTTVTLPKLTTTDYTYEVKTAATCTADGTGTYTWKTTTYGSFSFDVTLTKTGHSYAGRVTVAATCTQNGVKTYTCSACGDTYTESIASMGHDYQNGFCTVCGSSDPNGTTLSGTITSFGSTTDSVTMCIYGINSDTVLRTLTIKNGSFTIMGLPAGEYRISFSKQNHVTREYEVTLASGETVVDAKIHLIGDIDGNGKVNVGDVSKLNSHLKGTNKLTDEYMILCANVNGGSLNMGDTASLYAHIKGTKKLY